MFGSGRKHTIPRIAILETFAENPDDSLSAAEVIEYSGASRRAVYLILGDFEKEGLLTRIDEKGSRGRKYRLNPNDVRARSLGLMEQLLTVGGIEARLKRTRGLPQAELLEDSVLVDLRMPTPIRARPRPVFELIPESICPPIANVTCREVSREVSHFTEFATPVANGEMAAGTDIQRFNS